ncbi:hypothetical protein Acr_00g0024140 [Actinidia rufa]|uniref:CCHC-type domain-containing protein n=1 Tax=Actinidia rufa TaxID=165716 RepID=A0A7J0DD19_9ERIC|nr:hypothetical protein Acr_00g0024140 [Actinidia rufa]
MPPRQARGRTRSLTGARGARGAHGARGIREEGDGENHQESVMGEELEEMWEAMQVPARAADTRATTAMKAFLQLRSPTFKGEPDPLIAEDWLFAKAFVSTEEEKAKQFMRGLRPSIRNKIAGNLIKVYSTMVSAAVAIEETLNETRKITNSKSQREGTSNQSEGHSFKKPKSSTTQQQYPVRPSPNMSVVSSDQTSRRGPTCFGCHQYGHRVLDCPLKGQLRQSQSRAQSYSQTQDQTQVQASRATPTFTSAQTSYQSRPQAIAQQGQRTQGRVYAMTSAAGSSGATGQQEQQLDTSVVREVLDSVLISDTPVGRRTTLRRVCRSCEIVFDIGLLFVHPREIAFISWEIEVVVFVPSSTDVPRQGELNFLFSACLVDEGSVVSVALP